jgi:hypothetical protein
MGIRFIVTVYIIVTGTVPVRAFILVDVGTSN